MTFRKSRRLYVRIFSALMGKLTAAEFDYKKKKNAPHFSYPIAFAVSFLSRAFSENEKKRLRRGYARLLTIYNRMNDPCRRYEKGFRCKTLVNLH